jgi:hypothetical protein
MHQSNAVSGLKRSDKNGMAFSLGSRHNIAAEMHPVGEVDVEVATVPEHHLIAGRSPSVRVTGRIPSSEISLHLNDDSRKEIVVYSPDEILSQ